MIRAVTLEVAPETAPKTAPETAKIRNIVTRALGLAAPRADLHLAVQEAGLEVHAVGHGEPEAAAFGLEGIGGLGAQPGLDVGHLLLGALDGVARLSVGSPVSLLVGLSAVVVDAASRASQQTGGRMADLAALGDHLGKVFFHPRRLG